ncbi:hypothetical protein ABTM04_21260, partial [Acinetobacter baumannii]
SREQQAYSSFMTVRDAALKVAKAKSKKVEEVTAADIRDDAKVAALKLENDSLSGMVAQIPQFKPDQQPAPAKPEGFT